MTFKHEIISLGQFAGLMSSFIGAVIMAIKIPCLEQPKIQEKDEIKKSD